MSLCLCGFQIPVKTYQLTIDGHTYQVEIENLEPSPITVRVDGETFAVTVGREQAGPVAAAAPAARPSAAPSSTSRTMIAPMPGTILEMKVKPGDTVAFGDEIGVLEAMKMKSVLKAERAGAIAEVRVVAGQSVAYGDVLMVFA